jgi:4-hydroxy-4-methyl-2-oxoglutarate aldolase
MIGPVHEILRSLGAATVAESGGRPLPPGLIPVWAGAVLAAPAFPVRCIAGDNLAVHHAVATAPPGSALMVAVDGEPELGWWGEVLTVAAVSRGLVGLVIDACVRDTQAITERGFAAWARGVALPGARKEAAGSVGEPISIRGVAVRAGDWVVADADGVVVIDAEAVAAVAGAGQARADKEAAMFEALQNGRTTVELLGLEAP